MLTERLKSFPELEVESLLCFLSISNKEGDRESAEHTPGHTRSLHDGNSNAKSISPYFIQERGSGERDLCADGGHCGSTPPSLPALSWQMASIVPNIEFCWRAAYYWPWRVKSTARCRETSNGPPTSISHQSNFSVLFKKKKSVCMCVCVLRTPLFSPLGTLLGLNHLISFNAPSVSWFAHRLPGQGDTRSCTFDSLITSVKETHAYLRPPSPDIAYKNLALQPTPSRGHTGLGASSTGRRCVGSALIDR